MSSMRGSSKSGKSSKSEGSGGSQKTASTSSSTEIIIDLGTTVDIDDVQNDIKSRIKKEVKNNAGEWEPIWGVKFTEGLKNDEEKNSGMRNLGRVIGQEYFVVGMRYVDGKKTLASYRVDWDDIKGKHYNVDIISDKNTRKKYAYKFGDISKDIVLDSMRNKSVGELDVIDQMLSFTQQALHSHQLMTPKEAQKILSTFEIQSNQNRSYFKDFADLLRPLIEASHSVILASQEYKNEDAYKFDSAKLASQVTLDLSDVWSPIIDIYLAEISQKKEISEEIFNADVEEIFLSECIYSGGKNMHSESVMYHIENFFSTKEKGEIEKLMSYLEVKVPEADINKFHKFCKALFGQEYKDDLDVKVEPSQSEAMRNKVSSSQTSSASIFSNMMQTKSAAMNVLKRSQSIATSPTEVLPTSPSSTTSLSVTGKSDVSDNSDKQTNDVSKGSGPTHGSSH